MKALTIRQPWVHAILFEGKDVENRSWSTTYRGWLAVHAAGKPRVGARYPRGVRVPEKKELQFSSIVAVVDLLDVKKSSRSRWFNKPDRGEVNFAWILGTVRRLKDPIRMDGSLGLWNVPAGAVRKILKQLPRLDMERNHR